MFPKNAHVLEDASKVYRNSRIHKTSQVPVMDASPRVALNFPINPSNELFDFRFLPSSTIQSDFAEWKRDEIENDGSILVLKNNSEDINFFESADAAFERIPIHKLIMSIRSPVFKIMFYGQMSEATSNEVIIRDCDPAVMKELVRFIYTDVCDAGALQQHCEELLSVACKYQVLGLKILCERQLYSTLTTTNVIDVLCIAEMYDTAELKREALLFFERHALEITRHESFAEMSQSLSLSLCLDIIRKMKATIPSPLG